MRILLIDHGCCDPPRTRIHRLRDGLAAAGATVAVCGPSSLHGLDEQPAGMHGIHLHDVAAASRRLLAAVRAGTPDALLAAVATVPARLLGLVRETARQSIAVAADALYPDAIFVCHAGILTDLAVETGAPVVVHVSVADLQAATGRPSLQRLVAAAISSSLVVAADADTAGTLEREWLMGGEETVLATWPIDADAAGSIAEACRRAVARRRGVPE